MIPLPDPLHPAIVHVPIGLAVVMPLMSLIVAFGIRKGWFRVRTWVLILLLQLILMASAFVAVQTGEQQEENRPQIVAQEKIDLHEEYGRMMMIAAAVTFLLMFAGLHPKRAIAEKLQWLSIAGSFVVLYFAFLAGHSGGVLVY